MIVMEEPPLATKKSKNSSGPLVFCLCLFAVFAFALCSAGYYFWQVYWLPTKKEYNSSYSELSDKIGHNSAQLTSLRDQVTSLRNEGLTIKDSLSDLERLTEQNKFKTGSSVTGEKNSRLRLVLAEVELLLAAAIGELILSRDEGAALHYLELAFSVLRVEGIPQMSSVVSALENDLQALRDGKLVSLEDLAVPLAALRTEVEHLFVVAPYCFSNTPSKKAVPTRMEGQDNGFWGTIWNDLLGLVEVREIRASEDLTLLGTRRELARLVADMEFANARASAILGKPAGLQAASNSLVSLLKNHCDTSNIRVVSAIESLKAYRNLHSTNIGIPIRSSIEAMRALRKSLVGNKKREF